MHSRGRIMSCIRTIEDSLPQRREGHQGRFFFRIGTGDSKRIESKSAKSGLQPNSTTIWTFRTSDKLLSSNASLLIKKLVNTPGTSPRVLPAEVLNKTTLKGCAVSLKKCDSSWAMYALYLTICEWLKTPVAIAYSFRTNLPCLRQAGSGLCLICVS